MNVGAGTLIHPAATVTGNVTIGEDCRIGPGAVIGYDGFGYELQDDGTWQQKPQSHGVVIGNNVHIGANTCIDRGSYRDTVIGDGTRIDNLVHVAHNAQIGRNCLVIASAILCGSVVLKDGVYVAPGAIIREHRTVGARATVGLGAVVVKDVPAGVTVMGVPAREPEQPRKVEGTAFINSRPVRALTYSPGSAA